MVAHTWNLLVLGKLRQEDYQKFEISLGYPWKKILTSVSWSLKVLICNVLEGSREDKVASSCTRWPSAVSGNHYRIFNKPLVKRGLIILTDPLSPCGRALAANQSNVLKGVKESWHTVQSMLTGPCPEKTLASQGGRRLFKQP